MSLFAACKPLTRTEMAARVARDIPEGWYVNLGIGAPLQVADHVPAEREVIFHSENGVLGMGPAPAPENINRWLINAGKQYITLRTGGSYMHHADSFALIRGGHLWFRPILLDAAIAKTGRCAQRRRLWLLESVRRIRKLCRPCGGWNHVDSGASVFTCGNVSFSVFFTCRNLRARDSFQIKTLS